MQTVPNDSQRELVARLESRCRELEKRLARVSADRRRSQTPLEQDFSDQAIQRENDEVLDRLDEVERHELERTRIALRRIEADCFGLCDECGERIEPARLDVDPATAFCITCAENRERSSP